MKKNMIASTFTLFAVILLTFTACSSNPVDDVITAFDEGNISQVFYLMNALEEDVIQNDLSEILRERLDNTLQDFISEEITVITALNEVRDIEQLHIRSLIPYINLTRYIITRIDTSREALRLAQINIADGIYHTALINIDAIDVDDSNFELVMGLRRQATDGYRTDTISRATELANESEYARAINVIEVGLRTLENDPTLIQQISIFQEAQVGAARQVIFDNAARFATDNNWAGGIAALNAGLIEFPNDSQILERVRNFEDSYIANVMGFVEMFVSDGRYHEAVSALESVIVTIPNDARITNELARIEEIRPMTLGRLTLVDSSGYAHFVFGQPGVVPLVDSFGNQHYESHRFRLRRGDTAHSMYNLNRNFDTFSGYVVAPTGGSTYAFWDVHIFVGESSTPAVSINDFTVRTAPTPFYIDVTGAATVTVRVSLRSTIAPWHLGSQYLHIVDTLLVRS